MNTLWDLIAKIFSILIQVFNNLFSHIGISLSALFFTFTGAHSRLHIYYFNIIKRFKRLTKSISNKKYLICFLLLILLSVLYGFKSFSGGINGLVYLLISLMIIMLMGLLCIWIVYYVCVFSSYLLGYLNDCISKAIYRLYSYLKPIILSLFLTVNPYLCSFMSGLKRFVKSFLSGFRYYFLLFNCKFYSFLIKFCMFFFSYIFWVIVWVMLIGGLLFVGLIFSLISEVYKTVKKLMLSVLDLLSVLIFWKDICLFFRRILNSYYFECVKGVYFRFRLEHESFFIWVEDFLKSFTRISIKYPFNTIHLLFMLFTLFSLLLVQITVIYYYLFSIAFVGYHYLSVIADIDCVCLLIKNIIVLYFIVFYFLSLLWFLASVLLCLLLSIRIIVCLIMLFQSFYYLFLIISSFHEKLLSVLTKDIEEFRKSSFSSKWEPLEDFFKYEELFATKLWDLQEEKLDKADKKEDPNRFFYKKLFINILITLTIVFISTTLFVAFVFF